MAEKNGDIVAAKCRIFIFAPMKYILVCFLVAAPRYLYPTWTAWANAEEETCALDDETCSRTITLGVPQDLRTESAIANYQAAKKYLTAVVMADPAYSNVRENCRFENELCSYWAANGECQANPEFMLYKCAPSCQSCDLLDWNLRCSFNESHVLWNGTGQVQALKERLVRDYNAVVQSVDPWVLTVDDFLSEEDCQVLIQWGHKLGFERSVDAGKILQDGSMESIVSRDRTSTNAWCLAGCYDDPVTQAVLQRLETMLDIPRGHYEYFQLLKYEVGQFYRRHHDFNPQELDRPQGNRLLTVYIYLNDVETGGGTLFNSLDLKISPKRGRILIWPSVMDSNPLTMDGRTSHEALPVEEGVKYGANIWIHQRDFVTAFSKNCV